MPIRCQTVTYGRRLLRQKRADLRPGGPINLWIGIRLQTRFDDCPGQNPSAADLRLERDSEPDLHRGRLNGGGPLGAEWLDVDLEYDQPSDYLLDLHATLKLGDQLFLRVGGGSRISIVGALIPRTGSR